MEQSDHDVLIEIRQDLKNHIDKMEFHIAANERRFSWVENQIRGVYRYFWIAIGVVGTIEIIAKIK